MAEVGDVWTDEVMQKCHRPQKCHDSTSGRGLEIIFFFFNL